MNKIMSLICGIIFGIGLTVSQMIDPAKVLGFLNIFGEWDPSLAFVMIGAPIITNASDGSHSPKIFKKPKTLAGSIICETVRPIPKIIPQIKDIILFILNFLPKQLKFQQS